MHDEHTRPTVAVGDMPREAFRQSAHDVVDWMADYLEDLEQHPVVPSDLAPGDVRIRLAPLLSDDLASTVHHQLTQGDTQDLDEMLRDLEDAENLL